MISQLETELEKIKTQHRKIENALRVEKNFSNEIIQTSNAVIVGLDQDRIIEIFNDGAEQVTGYSRDEVLGKDWFKTFVRPELFDEMMEVWHDAWENDNTYINPILDKHGNEKIISWNNATILDENETPILIICIGQDISQQKKAEEHLEESEFRYKDIFENAPGAIFLTNADTRIIIDANRAASELMIMEKDEIVGIRRSELHPPDYVLEKGFREFVESAINIHRTELHPPNDILEKSFQEHIESTHDYVPLMDTYIARSDGVNLPVEIASRIRKIKGELYIQCIIRDITERMLAKKALKESEEKYRSVVEQANEGIILVQDGRIKYSNPFILKISGFTEDEFDGTPFVDFVHPDDIELVSERHKERLLKGHSDPYVIRYISKNGDIRWIEIQGSIITWKGKPTLLALLHDITDQRKADEALKQSEELFSAAFESNPSLMILYDYEKDLNIRINQATVDLLGCSKQELTSKKWRDIDCFVEPDRMVHILEIIDEKGGLKDFELKALTKDGEERLLLFSGEHLNLTDKKMAILSAKDITEEARAIDERRKNSLKYNLEGHNVYLVKEATHTVSLEAFNELLEFGYDGIVFSRSPRKEFWEAFEEDVEFYWLSERGEGQTISSMKNILEILESLPNKMTILLDRFEYLVLKEGIEKAIQFIYSIREIAYLKNLIIIISTDPDVLDSKIDSILNKETLSIEPGYTGKLSDRLKRTLKFIYDSNLEGNKPTYSDIGKELLISRPTVKKRLDFLKAGGYIREEERGSRKLVEITEKGRREF